MGQFKDVLTGQNGWIHELARAEVHPEAEKLLQLGRSSDPQQLVEENTIEFLVELRENFNRFAKLFNGYSENGGRYQEVKVYSLAQTAADFMMFRNQVKLVVSNSAHGVIQISFSQHSRSSFAVDGQDFSKNQATSGGGFPQSQELLAQVGPFRDVFWTYKGEKVTAEQVTKFYFSEFVRSTRSMAKSKLGNELLLEQIKTFLQEKGLDL